MKQGTATKPSSKGAALNHGGADSGRRAATGSTQRELPRLVDIATAAEVLGVGVRHVRRLVAERRIPFIKVGHYVRFDPELLAAWIDDRRVDAARR